MGTAAAQRVVEVRGRAGARPPICAWRGLLLPRNAAAAALTLLTLKSVEMGCGKGGQWGVSE